MNRREFITLLGGAVAWPLAARAQQTDRVRRIGVLNLLAINDEANTRIAVFREGLQKLGWTVGGNLRIEYRWAAATPTDCGAMQPNWLK